MKYLAVVTLALAVSLLGALWGLLETREKLGATLARAEASEQLLAQEYSRAERIQGLLDAARRQAQESRLEVDRALEENPEWAAGAVPRSVTDGLCRAGSCSAPRSEVSASAD